MSYSPTPPARETTGVSRFEYKYLIDERTAVAVRDFARSRLVRDTFADARRGDYPTHSVYLDAAGLPIYRASCDGHRNRFKIRARYYDDKPDGVVFFEIKRRLNNTIVKERARIHRPAALEILRGRPPVAADLVKVGDVKQLESLRRFAELRDADGGSTPRVIVSYLREAWVKEGESQTRLTFDRELRGARWAGRFEAARGPVCPLPLPQAQVVLEMKFVDRFPTWFADMARELGLERRSMAKYCRVTDQLNGYARV
ncbi:MAG TPA: polyphosphate polymerase domain-containing protein [Tepidisphaeraceae bacterium]|nr:polyphosphate polymerase domain-containing protein [Tepidisphaeraceae bacterium]